MLKLHGLYLHALPPELVGLYREWEAFDPFAALRDAVADGRVTDEQTLDGYCVQEDQAAVRHAEIERALALWTLDSHYWVGRSSSRPSSTAERIQHVFQAAPVLTPGLVATTMTLFSLPRVDTEWMVRPRVVKRWLGRKIGQRVFAIAR